MDLAWIILKQAILMLLLNVVGIIAYRTKVVDKNGGRQFSNFVLEIVTPVLVVAPCTANTAAKLANGITDTTATMAVKSMLRRQKPIVLAIATNDALRASAKNIGLLLNTKHYYFVPLRQDAPTEKPASMVADFTKLPETVALARDGRQIQPIFG